MYVGVWPAWRGIVRSRTGLIALTAFVLTAAAACGPGTADRSGSSAAPPPVGQQAVRLAAAAQASPRQVRAQFEQLLGLHALLAVRQMRSLVAAAPELQRATEASLQANTDTLSRLVAVAYGGPPADRFTPLWQRHLVDLVAYAKAVAGNDTSPEQLRSALAMLLGEHLELIVDAQRATFAGSPEFDAAAAQVNANTTALTKAMAGIVGPAKAAEFQTAWANHVEGLMAYTAAVAANNQAGKAAAKQNLDGFAERLALYFSEVVRNVLATDPLTDAITAHDTHLIAHVEAY